MIFILCSNNYFYATSNRKLFNEFLLGLGLYFPSKYICYICYICVAPLGFVFNYCCPGNSALQGPQQDRDHPVDQGRVRAGGHQGPLGILQIQTHRQRRRE